MSYYLRVPPELPIGPCLPLVAILEGFANSSCTRMTSTGCSALCSVLAALFIGRIRVAHSDWTNHSESSAGRSALCSVVTALSIGRICTVHGNWKTHSESSAGCSALCCVVAALFTEIERLTQNLEASTATGVLSYVS